MLTPPLFDKEKLKEGIEEEERKKNVIFRVLDNGSIGVRCDLRVVKWREVEIFVDRMLYEDCFVVGDVVPNVVQIIVLML